MSNEGPEQQTVVFNCHDVPAQDADARRTADCGDFQISLTQKEGDAPKVSRMEINGAGWSLELLPSKGLTIRSGAYKGKPLFWNAPTRSYEDPDLIDLAAPVLMDGKPVAGTYYLTAHTGSLELYGLKSWGMHVLDTESQKIRPLHGEASFIPVDTVKASLVRDNSDDFLQLTTTYPYRDYTFISRKKEKDSSGAAEHESEIPWHMRGAVLFMVTRTIFLSASKPWLKVVDDFENTSADESQPDWGYHLTFDPMEGSRVLFPAHEKSPRGGQPLARDQKAWRPAKTETKREEWGLVYKEIDLQKNNPRLDGKAGITSLIQHPDGSAIALTHSPAPYCQSWFSAGGKGSDEWQLEDGTPILLNNWDGIGIEIGASSVDHDDNVESSILSRLKPLQPGDKQTVEIVIEMLDSNQARPILESIENWEK